MMTLKEMLDQILQEAGFTPLDEYFGSSRAEARQITSLANRELNKLTKDKWTALRKQQTVTMSNDTFYPLPTDWLEYVPDTAWSNTRRVDFPTSSDVWMYYVSRNIYTGLRHRMRITDGQLEIQNPADGNDIVIEYISNAAVLDNAQNPKTRFSADDDTLILNDDLFMLGVKWRWTKLKGLDWGEDYKEWRDFYKSELATDGGAQTIETGMLRYEGPFPPTADYWVSH